jgi:nitrogenase iron protein NifH
MPTILGRIGEAKKVTEEMLTSVVFQGFNGVLGCERGGPKPGMGCAGKGVNLAPQFLDQFQIFEKYGVAFVLFDVLGDVVCGGFAQPMRSGYAREIYLVTCGEALTLFQVNNIIKAAHKLAGMGADVGIAGIIDNMRGVSRERDCRGIRLSRWYTYNRAYPSFENGPGCGNARKDGDRGLPRIRAGRRLSSVS